MHLGDSISSRHVNTHPEFRALMEPCFPGFLMTDPEMRIRVGVILLRNSARKRGMGVYSFARAAVTKYHMLSGLNNRNVLTHHNGG